MNIENISVLKRLVIFFGKTSFLSYLQALLLVFLFEAMAYVLSIFLRNTGMLYIFLQVVMHIGLLLSLWDLILSETDKYLAVSKDAKS